MYPRSCEIRRDEISAPGPSARPSRISGSTPALAPSPSPRSLSVALRLTRGEDLSKVVGAGEDCARGNATSVSGFGRYVGRHEHSSGFVDGRLSHLSLSLSPSLCLLGRLAALLPDWRDGWLSSDADAIPIPGCQRQSCGRRVHS